MGRILLLVIVIAAIAALAIAVFRGDQPVPPPSGDPAAPSSADGGELADPGNISSAPKLLVTARGRVVRMGSQVPLAKVKVRIGNSESLSEADGSFSLLKVPTGPVEVHLAAEDLPAYVVSLTLRETDPDLGEIAIPADTLFTGRVTGPGGNPVSGAVVRILERERVEIGTWWRGPKYEQLKLGAALLDEGEAAPGQIATAGNDGGFEVKGLSPGKYYFDVVAEAYAHSDQLDVEIPSGGSVHREVVLGESGTIRGSVLDGRRSGIGSARVMALPWNEAVEVPYSPILEASSKPDGAFEFTGMKLGEEYLILARAPDGKIGLGIRVKAPAEDVEIRVGPRFTLKGTVVDDETGVAITGAELYAILGSARTDENGSYVLEGVVRSPFFRMVWISADGYEDKQHEFDLAGSILGRAVVEEDFRLTKVRPGTLRVTVRDLDGNPLAGVALVATEWGSEKPVARGVTRATGEALLTGVPPSAQELTAMKPGYVMVLVNESGSERAGWPTDTVDVRVMPGADSLAEVTLAPIAEASGRVIDQEGKPLPGVLVYSNSGESFATTNDQGLFTAKRLPGSVRVGLRFELEGYLDTAAEVTPGSGEAVEVTMVRGGTLAGRVVDAEGQPVAGAEVVAGVRAGEGGRARATTGIDGTFSIPGLASARYVVLAQRDGFAPQKSAAVDLLEGETREGIELVLGKGIKVTVVAVLEDGTQVAAGAVVYGPLSRPAPERVVYRGIEPMEFRLLPGRYRVLATPLAPDTGAGAVEQDLDLSHEGTVRVTLATGGVGIEIKAKVGPDQRLAGLSLQRTEPPEPPVHFWFPASPEGALRSPPLPPGRYKVTVYSETEEGHWMGREIEDLEPSEKPVEVDLTGE